MWGAATLYHLFRPDLISHILDLDADFLANIAMYLLARHKPFPEYPLLFGHSSIDQLKSVDNREHK